MTKKEAKQQIQELAKKYLLDNYITPDTTLLIAIKSVSSSGMTRRMKVVVNNHDITHLIADLCGLSQNKNGLKIQGCGMDMTFWLVDYITSYLFPEQQKNKSLPSNGGTTLAWNSI